MPEPVPQPLPTPPVRPTALVRTLTGAVLIAALFCIVAGGALLVRHWQSKADDPLKSPQVTALKEQLRNEPRNEVLKQRIRELDLRLRRRYFQELDFRHTGGWLLLGGLVVMVWSARRRAALRAQPPFPLSEPDADRRRTRAAVQARWAVAAVAGLTGATLLGWSLSARSTLPDRPAELAKLLAQFAGESGPDLTDLPSPGEIRANWPRFLGPDGNACVTNFILPAAIDVATGAGLVWKVPLPAPGFGSPIVWTNRVYLSGGDATNRAVFCFDAATGTLVWQRPVVNIPGSPAQAPEIPESTGYAAPTMATDGRRVFAWFGNGDLVAFTLAGAPVWSKNPGVPKNAYGHATSLVSWQGRLIVQFDQGEPEEGKSRLYALAAATGNVLWQKSRPVGSSWATPVVAEAAGKTQIITLGGKWVIAYNATDGNELWRVEGLNGEITPSPIFTAGLAVITSPSDKLMAIRLDGSGNVSKTHIAWSSEENVPDITSPVGNGELVFTASSNGMLTCFDIKDGKKLWEQDLNFEVNASPAIAGDRLIVFGKKGAIVVAAAGRQFQSILKADLGEQVLASPAFAAHRMFVRTAKSLVCLGTKSGPGPAPGEAARR
jgi:outer membrane protein assembly factor BamB